MKKKITLLFAFCAISIWSFGQIFITELADPLDSYDCRYVELYNAGDVDVDLSADGGYGLQRYTNGGLTPQATIYDLTGTIKAKGFYVVAKVAASFETNFGFAPDQEIDITGAVTDMNGDDQLQLLDPNDVIIDFFGVVGEDGNGTCHGYLDGRAERKAGVSTGNAGTWSVDFWNVWGADVATGCASYVQMEVNTFDNIFDPGEWIGSSNTIVNFESLKTVIAEDGVSVDICVSIENPSAISATTVDVSILGKSTAIDGTDYTGPAFPYTMTFPAGSSDAQCLTIVIADDAIPEPADTLVLQLENVVGEAFATKGPKNQHVLIIDDNDLVCPGAGDIIISEVMFNPSAVSDASGEWFEIYNSSDTEIDLAGMEFKDDVTDGESFKVAQTLLIAPDEYLVFAISGDEAVNGGFEADYVYGSDVGFGLGNSTDGIIFQCLANEIDAVIWDGGITFPGTDGASISLKVDQLDAVANDDGANWEVAVSPYGDGDLGTPGNANDIPNCYLSLSPLDATCDAITADMDTYTISIPFTNGSTSVYDITTTSGVVAGDDPSTVASGTIMITGITERENDTVKISNIAAGGSCDYVFNIEAPTCFPDNYGNIFITEIADPEDNVTARYIELFNAGDTDVDLNAGFGLQRYTNGGTDPQTTIHYLTGTIPAKGFYIVVRSASGFEATYGYAPDQEIGDSGPADSNGDDQIQLLDPHFVVRDIFGVPGEDGTGTCHGFEDGRAERALTVTEGNTGTWNEANWNVWGVTEGTGCTNHITQEVNTTDNIFDPGAWIGFVPVNTIVNFELLISEIAEDGASIDVCVSILNPDDTNPTTVDVNVLDISSAVNGTDYASISFPQTLTFPAGSSDNQCLTIAITDDAEIELPDTLSLSLENVAGGASAAIGTQIQHNLVITDNDLVCPNAGDVIISEVMQNPSKVGDGDGEWFEIHNTTGADIDLFAMEFKDDATTSEFFFIDKSLILPADGYLVFAVNGDTAVNGGLRTDYVYQPDPPFTLANATDGIILQCIGSGIDTVIWDDGATFPDPNGASMSLKPANMNATDNDDGANWEMVTFAYGDGDFGTPGCANDAPCCYLNIEEPLVTCDAETFDMDTYTVAIDFTDGGGSVYTITASSGIVGGDDPSTMSTGTITVSGINEGENVTVTISNIAAGGSCNFVSEVESPACFTIVCADAGSVIFTEIMQDPSTVGDDLGEWFELYNTTNTDINLQGWSIIDDDKSLEEEGFTIDKSLVIPSGGYLLFANNADEATNGGLPAPDYVFGTDFLLGNNTDGVSLQCSEAVIDVVVWDAGATFPDPTGASMTLDLDHFNASDNDNGANWHTSATAYGDGDFGTPGSANEIVSVKHKQGVDYRMYPNPSNDGRFGLRFKDDSKRVIEIYDMLGKKVFEQEILSAEEMVSSNLDIGIYIVKVTENDKTASHRLIIE